MYLYESCTGSLYTSNEELDYNELDCETCGDGDSFLGKFNSKEGLIRLLNHEGFDLEGCEDFINGIYK